MVIVTTMEYKSIYVIYYADLLISRFSEVTSYDNGLPLGVLRKQYVAVECTGLKS